MGNFISAKLPISKKDIDSKNNGLIEPISWDHTVCGIRPQNEDTHVITTLAKNPDWHYFAVFDGHNGTEAAQYCAACLHLRIDSELVNLQRASGKPFLTFEDVKYALVKCIVGLDDEFLNHCIEKDIDAGCTLVVVLLNVRTRMMVVANLGDSRAIMSRANGRTETLSFDHKPTDRNEIARIEAADHTVEDGRLDDTLACSRAIGNPFLKAKDRKLLAEKKALCPYPYLRDFFLYTGLNQTSKNNLKDFYKDMIKPQQKAARKRFLEESKSRVEEKKRLKDERKEKELQRRKECEAKGVPYVKTKRKKRFDTDFRYPTSEFKFRSLMIVDDEIEDDPATKSYQFLVIACDGLYDVMTNREVTSWVNTKLRERAKVNKIIQENAFLDMGLDATGSYVKKSTAFKRRRGSVSANTEQRADASHWHVKPRIAKKKKKQRKKQKKILKKRYSEMNSKKKNEVLMRVAVERGNSLPTRPRRSVPLCEELMAVPEPLPQQRKQIDPVFYPLDTLASELCEEALKRGTTDNVSIMIVMLEPPPIPLLRNVALTRGKLRRNILKRRVDKAEEKEETLAAKTLTPSMLVNAKRSRSLSPTRSMKKKSPVKAEARSVSSGALEANAKSSKGGRRRHQRQMTTVLHRSLSATRLRRR